MNISFKTFLISFVITFIVTSLHLLSALPKIDILSFFNEQKENVKTLPEIDKLLKEKPNAYRLKTDNSLITGAHASSSEVGGNSHIVVDFDSGEVISEKNMSKTYSIASITKVMTAVVALDIANPNEKFVVSEKAARQIPTKIGVVPGEKMSVVELLEASLLTSANDAVEVIEEGIDAKYGRGTFVQAMNEKARIIGLKNTSFQNPQGFDAPNHYSTSEDVAVLSHYALTNYPLIAEISKKDYIFLPKSSSHKQFDLQNWNGLIGVYPNMLGLKIGYTEDAGKTTVVLSEREGKRILAVVLGAPGTAERDLWAANLLDQGYRTTMNLSEIKVTPDALQEKYDSWQYWN